MKMSHSDIKHHLSSAQRRSMTFKILHLPSLSVLLSLSKESWTDSQRTVCASLDFTFFSISKANPSKMVPFRVSLSPDADIGCGLLLLFDIILIVLGPLSPWAVYCFSYIHILDLTRKCLSWLSRWNKVKLNYSENELGMLGKPPRAERWIAAVCPFNFSARDTKMVFISPKLDLRCLRKLVTSASHSIFLSHDVHSLAYTAAKADCCFSFHL